MGVGTPNRILMSKFLKQTQLYNFKKSPPKPKAKTLLKAKNSNFRPQFVILPSKRYLALEIFENGT